jgi:hypothetical protein
MLGMMRLCGGLNMLIVQFWWSITNMEVSPFGDLVAQCILKSHCKYVQGFC